MQPHCIAASEYTLISGACKPYALPLVQLGVCLQRKEREAWQAIVFIMLYSVKLSGADYTRGIVSLS